MAKFADQLFTDLMTEYRPVLEQTELPSQRRKPSTKPIWLTSGLATVVALIITVSLLLTTGAPAYAVTRNPDGTVTLTLQQISALAAAVAALHSVEPGPTAGCELDSKTAAFPPSATNSVVLDPKAPSTGVVGTVVVAATTPGDPPKLAWVVVTAPVTQSCAALTTALNAARDARANGTPTSITNGELVPAPLAPGYPTPGP